LLGVGEEEVTARLKEVGQELAFHFASDPELRRRFAEAVARTRPRRKRAAELPAAEADGVGRVRAALLGKGTSSALKKRLAGGP
jgi:hypothetical protein